MAEDKCKHEGQEGTFCGNCGKQLGADPEVEGLVERVVRKVLTEGGVKLTPKVKIEAETSLADKLGLNKRKEGEK